MRPIRLQLRGFAAFREPVEIDFDGVDFFALMGPTGSGKSTIIDAICFALYGSVPRYDDNRRVGFAVTTGASEARVSLTFALGNNRYIATRVVRRKPDGSTTTKEARLERQLAGAETEVLAGSAPELEKAVGALIGLPFAHFTKCVVLPQGEFARFLHDKPSDRQELLVRLLNLRVYERIGGRARELSATLVQAARLEEERLGALSFATNEAKVDASSRLTKIEKLYSDFKKAKPKIEALERAAEAAREEAVDARALVSLLRKVAVPATVVSLARRLANEKGSLAIAEKEIERHDADIGRIMKRRQSMPKLAPLQLLLSSHNEVENCRGTIEHALTELENAKAKEEQAIAGVQAAHEAVEAARALAQASREEHSAHALAKKLKVGAACPVCQRLVTSIPKRRAPSALRDAETAENRAAEVLQEANRKREGMTGTRQAAESSLNTERARMAKLMRQIASSPGRAELKKQIEEIEIVEKDFDKATEKGATLRKAVAPLRESLESTESKLREYGNAFNRQRDALITLGPPSPKRADLATDWHTLAAWGAAQVPLQTKRAEEAETTATQKNTQKQAELARLRERCKDCGICLPEEFANYGDAILTAEVEARRALHDIVAAIKEAKELKEEIHSQREEAEVARMLGQLLSAKGFEQWLVSEAIERLVEGASGTLRQLSAGQYSLRADDKGEFMVVDHRNADEIRSAKTLSGGETFQASLALALALADQLGELASEGASSLEAIFLDEGFGTLDPDALLIAGDTIEKLQSKGRMVGIVTHVRELAERVPVRYVVQKGSRTSSVERVIA